MITNAYQSHRFCDWTNYSTPAYSATGPRASPEGRAMSKLKGTKTQQNLKEAFAGEKPEPIADLTSAP
jgi:hypothetical protein